MYDDECVLDLTSPTLSSCCDPPQKPVGFSAPFSRFYGETRRSVDAGLVHLGEAERNSITANVVSTVFMLNSALGTLVNGILDILSCEGRGTYILGTSLIYSTLGSSTILDILLSFILTKICVGGKNGDIYVKIFHFFYI